MGEGAEVRINILVVEKSRSHKWGGGKWKKKSCGKDPGMMHTAATFRRTKDIYVRAQGGEGNNFTGG